MQIVVHKFELSLSVYKSVYANTKERPLKLMKSRDGIYLKYYSQRWAIEIMGKIHFSIVDVFSQGKYTGNQLAVFKNAENLSDDKVKL